MIMKGFFSSKYLKYNIINQFWYDLCTLLQLIMRI